MKDYEKIFTKIVNSTDKKKVTLLLNQLWHIAVFMTHGDRCILCGRKAVDAHHIIRRSQSAALKYDVKNGVPLCKGCHRYKIHEGDPVAMEKLLKYIGDKRLKYLKKHKKDYFKNSLSNLKATAGDLYEYIKNL